MSDELTSIKEEIAKVRLELCNIQGAFSYVKKAELSVHAERQGVEHGAEPFKIWNKKPRTKRDQKMEMKVADASWHPDSSKVLVVSSSHVEIQNIYLSFKEYVLLKDDDFLLTGTIEPTKGNLFGVGGLGNACSIYDTSLSDEAEPIQVLRKHDGYISKIAWWNESQVLTGSGDWSICLWDVLTGVPTTQFFGHEKDIQGLATVPNDENLFISGSMDRTCRVWDKRQKGGAVNRFFMSQEVHDIATLNQDTFGCCGDGIAHLLDIRAMKRLQLFFDSTDQQEGSAGIPFMKMDFSKSGKYAFIGTEDNCVLPFNVLTGEDCDFIELNGGDEGGSVKAIEVSPDGSALLVANQSRLSVFSGGAPTN